MATRAVSVSKIPALALFLLLICGGSIQAQPAGYPAAAWGANYAGEGTVPAGTFIAIDAGNYYNLALRPDGTIVAWGGNFTQQTNPPEGSFTAIAAGAFHGLALRADGTLAVWGNSMGPWVPDGAFIAIAAGEYHNIALRTDGTIVGWGTNWFGESTAPPGTYTAIAAGRAHNLALRTDGTLVQWGYTHPLGQVPAGTFTAIAAGEGYNLALRDDGTIVGWGYDDLGQATPPAGTFTAIAAGAFHGLALRADGTVVGWGSNVSGQLGVPEGTFVAISAGTNHSLALRYADTTPPAITLTPACPALLTLGSSFIVDVAVTDEDSGVAIQSVPTGPLSLDTASVGPHLLTIEATDHVGNSATTGCSYDVIYDFAGAGGFAAPVADQPGINTANAGSAVPVKWQLPDGHGGYIGDLAAVTSITFGEVVDFDGAPGTEIEAKTPGRSGLRYDPATQQFVFIWNTDRAMAGRSYMLVLRLRDGMEYYANFTLK